MRNFKESVTRIPIGPFDPAQARDALIEAQKVVAKIKARAEAADERVMNAKLETLRLVALASPELTLDLKRFVLEIALTLQNRVNFDREDSGRLIWIVGEPDGTTWAVSMPADWSDVEALRSAS